MRSGSPCNGQPEAYLREEEAEQGADGVPEVKAMAVVDEEDEGVRLYGVQHHRRYPGRGRGDTGAREGYWLELRRSSGVGAGEGVVQAGQSQQRTTKK